VPTCFRVETAANRTQNQPTSMTCRIGDGQIRPKYAQRPQTQDRANRTISLDADKVNREWASAVHRDPNNEFSRGVAADGPYGFFAVERTELVASTAD
jgi:hypothetical protein